MADRISFNDKVQGDSPQGQHTKQLWYTDVNDIKDVVDSHADDIEASEASITANTADIATNTETLRSNIPNKTIQTPFIDWTGNIQEYARIWTAVNSGNGPILIPNNTTVIFRTKRITYTEFNNADSYTVSIKTWREERKYTPTTGVPTLGTAGNIVLSSANSLLNLINEEKYTVENGVIVNGLIEDLGTVSSISTSVNDSTSEYDVIQDEYLFIDDAGNEWIYNGGENVIGNGSTTVDADFVLLVDTITTPEETLNPSMRFYNDGVASHSGEPFINAGTNASFTYDANTGITDINVTDKMNISGDISSTPYTLVASDSGKTLNFTGSLNQVANINENVFAKNDRIDFWRDGTGDVSLNISNNVTAKGLQDTSGQYRLNERYTAGVIYWESPTGVRIIGFDRDEPSTTIVVSSLSPNTVTQAQTVNITVTGTGFTSGTTVTSSAGLTINTVTFNSSVEMVLNVTATGNSNDTIDLTFDNGIQTVVTNAITLLSSSLVLYEQFDYTGAPNTALWNLTNPNSSTISFNVNNGQLEIDRLLTGAIPYGQNALASVSNFDITSFKAFHFTLESPSQNDASVWVAGAILNQDATNTDNRFGFARSETTGKISVFLVLGGSSVTLTASDFDLDITTLTDVRITYDGTTISFEYYNLTSGSWVVVSTATTTITGSWYSSIVTSSSSGTGSTDGLDINIGEILVVDQPYTTRKP